MGVPLGPTPLQLADLASVLEVPGFVRGPIAFGVVAALGALLLWRYEGLVDRALDRSMARPLRSLGYGIAAHATLAFAGVYLISQFAQLTVSGRSLAPLGIALALSMLAVAAALGFTVVGLAAVEVGLERPRWQGVLAGAALAGVAAALTPVVGGLVWLVAVSTGIGGPVRAWVRASEDVEAVRAD